MKNYKILVNRQPLSEKYIESRQDFGKVLKGVKQLKPPLWKSAWFYGPVGMATVALTISVSSIHANEAKEVIVEKKKYKNHINTIETNKKITELTEISEVPIIKMQQSELKVEKTEVKKKKTETIDKTPNIKEKQIINVEPKKEIIEEKITLKKTYPNIKNVVNGDITFSDLFSDEGITCGTNKILSFTIQYFNGVKDVIDKVEGNTIPQDIAKYIKRYNYGTMIFITNIKAVDENNDIITLPSLNYIPRY